MHEACAVPAPAGWPSPSGRPRRPARRERVRLGGRRAAGARSRPAARGGGRGHRSSAPSTAASTSWPRDALADLEDFWADGLPRRLRRRSSSRCRAATSASTPTTSTPREFPQGVGCGSDPQEVGEQRLLLPVARRRPTPTRSPTTAPSSPSSPSDYGRVPPRPGDGARVRARRPGAGRAAPDRRSRPRRRPTASPAPGPPGWPTGEAAALTPARAPELDELLRGYFLLRDPVGTSTAEESAHGSYFDRVSAFQDGLRRRPRGLPRRLRPGPASSPRASSDRDDGPRHRRQRRPTPTLLGIVDGSLPGVLGAGVPRRLRRAVHATGDRAVRRPTRPDCAPDADLDLVFCPDEELVGFDERRPRPGRPTSIGDFAVATAVAIPYGLAARDQLGLSDRRRGRPCARRVCLTGWYAAQVYNGQAGETSSSPPATSTRASSSCSTYGNDPRRAAGRRPQRLPAGRPVPRAASSAGPRGPATSAPEGPLRRARR